MLYFILDTCPDKEVVTIVEERQVQACRDISKRGL